MWERRNNTFSSLGSLGVSMSGVGAAEAARGHVMIAGSDGELDFLLDLQIGGSLPDESCIANEDADGDGLAGCDDPDCWEACWPACPFAASCSF